MQQSFLEYVLKDLQNERIPLEACTFILPSKRSGTFLKKYIAETLTQNIFSPEILSVADFVEEISGIASASTIELLLILYQTYKESEIENHDDFFTFLKWGQVLIQDFNEIDRYLIPANEILNYLSAIKELNHWSLKKEKTELIENYLRLWGNLRLLYNSFTSKLLSKSMGYQGLVYRAAVDNLSSTKKQRNNHLIFIGFNALNNAESHIIQHFLEQEQNRIYWDIDPLFLDDPIHDAGLFIRNYRKEWPYYKNREMKGLQSHSFSKKDISIIGVPKNISQAKYAGTLLNQIAKDQNFPLTSTALVLADESLLHPVLQAIPKSVEKVNVTMGVRLDHTVLYDFFLSFLELHVTKTEKGWFHTSVLAFTSNPYSSRISISGDLNTISQDIKLNNWIYLNTEKLKKYHESFPLLKILFPQEKVSSVRWVDDCLQLINLLKGIFQQENNTLELEYTYRFYTVFNQLKLYLSELDFVTDLKSLKSFFKQLSAVETMDFIGEPLSGLQIMGMLESRNLDFDTVILTSVNEGILPSGKSNNSFIPFDVKSAYGLPTYKEKDAIYTYHFYRLLQRAHNIHILYNTEPDVLEGGEKSRLVHQLLTDSNLNAQVTHTIATPEVKINPVALYKVPKSVELIEDIKRFANQGFSPTSLTNYIRNPIDFYKQSVLKIDIIPEVEETIAASTFGTIIHDSLEQLYTPLVGKRLTHGNVSKLREKVTETVTVHFHKNLQGAETKTGRFLLVFNVIVKYLQNFITLEMNQIERHKIKILALEKKHRIQLYMEGLDFPIWLKGTIDRVDEIDGVTRIVDYKTGRVEPRNVKLLNWDALLTDYDKSKAFQLLCYSLLYSKEKNTNSMIAGIYSFKNLSKGFLPLHINTESITNETLTTFEAHLERLILEICNPSVPLVEKEV